MESDTPPLLILPLQFLRSAGQVTEQSESVTDENDADEFFPCVLLSFDNVVLEKSCTAEAFPLDILGLPRPPEGSYCKSRVLIFCEIEHPQNWANSRAVKSTVQ